MIKCIQKELEQRSTETSATINTIYFGGGTPSLLSDDEIHSLMGAIKDNYDLDSTLEITLEANPDDLNEKNLANMYKNGINRLSIGIQSLNDDILFQLNRTHTSEQAIQSIELAQNVGFRNISIDLMFGLPDLTDEMWIKTLNDVIDTGTQHVSCYNLTIEERTALWHFVNQNKVSLPTERNQESQFLLTQSILKEAGFDHYEISNYAQKGFRSKHNSNYWSRVSYLGFGPSAHSFLGNIRKWNVSNNAKYMAAMESGNSMATLEHLSKNDQFNETIMLGLRTESGVKIKDLELYLMNTPFINNKNNLIKTGILIESTTHLRLSKEAYFLSDYYSSELFLDND